MFKKNIFWFLLVVLMVIPAFSSIVRSGYYPMQDSHHVFRIDQMEKCFSDGQIPCRWIPDAGYGHGYPQFNFYAPLIYYVGTLFHSFGFQIIDSVKIIIALGFVVGAVGMFIFTREFFGNFAGAVSAVLYTYAPYKAQQVYVRGALSEFWAGVFFPLVLWSLYKLIKGGGKKYFLLTSMFIAFLLLTHNLLSFLFVPVIVFWALFWLYMEKWKSVRLVFLALLSGFFTSAFFVLPMVLERGYVHVETLLGGYFDYRQHFVTIKELFFSNHWGYGSSVLGPVDDLSLSAGVVHWILGLASVGFALIRFKKDKKLSLIVLTVGLFTLALLFLMHEKSSFLWVLMTPLSWLQFPWRLLLLTSFSLSLIAAYVVFGLGKVGKFIGVLAVISVFILHAGFFTPKEWLVTDDHTELSGEKWEKQLTNSIFDYLPIYAESPPEFKAREVPEILSGSAFFENYYKGSNFQSGKLYVDQDAVIRVPIFDFPGMTVYLNGISAGHVNNNCSGESFCHGLVTFLAPAGEYDFKVVLENTPVRSLGNTLSILSALGLTVVLFRKNEKFFKN